MNIAQCVDPAAVLARARASSPSRGFALVYLVGAIALLAAISAVIYGVKSYVDDVDRKAYERGYLAGTQDKKAHDAAYLEGERTAERSWQQAMNSARTAWDAQRGKLEAKVQDLGRQLADQSAERDALNEQLITRGEQHEVDRPAVCTFTADELCDWNDASAGRPGTCQPAAGAAGTVAGPAALPEGAAAPAGGNARGGEVRAPPGGQAVPRMR